MLMRVLHQKNYLSWILLRYGVSRRSLFRDLSIGSPCTDCKKKRTLVKIDL